MHGLRYKVLQQLELELPKTLLVYLKTSTLPLPPDLLIPFKYYFSGTLAGTTQVTSTIVFEQENNGQLPYQLPFYTLLPL